MKYLDTNKDWFVVGFPFAQDSKVVLLIEKQKAWCKGLWNGVGGGVEPEDAHSGIQVHKMATAAMVREFREETGLDTELSDWECYCLLDEPKAMIFIFRMFTDYDFLADAESKTIERVDLLSLSALSAFPLMPNLGWLIPMAQDRETLLANVEQLGGQYDGNR